VTAVVVKNWGIRVAARGCLVECLQMTQPEADDTLRAPLPWTTELSDEVAAGLTRCLRARARANVSDAPVVVSI
jgi:hypothetical protein